MLEAWKSLIIRLEATLQPNTRFTFERALTVFTRSDITLPKMNDLNQIWSTLYTLDYIVWGSLWQSLDAIRAVARA